MSIIVKTIREEDAHPLYLEWLRWRTGTLQLAARLARKGYQEAALRLRDAVDSAGLDPPGVPKLKSDTKERGDR